MAAFSTGDRGGPVTLKLLPNSPSVPFFMNQVTRILVERDEVIWDGSAKHIKTGASVTLKRGILISGPVWYTMGKGEAGQSHFQLGIRGDHPRLRQGEFRRRAGRRAVRGGN